MSFIMLFQVGIYLLCVATMESSTFSLNDLITSFVDLSSQTNTEGEIPMMAFILAYRDLIKLFDVLGRAFSFVKNDLVAKTDILEQIALKDPQRFITVEKLVIYEVSNNLTIVYAANGNNYSGRYNLVNEIIKFKIIKVGLFLDWFVP
jgi:hypothetical protein